MPPGLRAAVDVGRMHGIAADDPVVLQETNNTVVWLRPHDVIAKVGTRSDSREELVREYEVARALAAGGAAVASPFADSLPTTHQRTGFVVTLWDRLERDESAEPPAAVVGGSLRRLHEALDSCDVELPDFRVDIRRARRGLDDESRLVALAPDDRTFLQDVFDALLPAIETRAFAPSALHGEPHDGNRICTPLGIRWIDFETACRGPVEWDLAFLPEEARASFDVFDEELLELLSSLNSARIATWCWMQARFPEMRWHAELHLGFLREVWPT